MNKKKILSKDLEQISFNKVLNLVSKLQLKI